MPRSRREPHQHGMVQSRQPRGLHDRACRPAGPIRAGRVLDCRRHRRDHGRLVDHHRDLFRLPRRRSQRPDRAAGAQQQYAYEDRIAELRAQIDRTTSRQLLDQEQFEQKLDDLMRRQATLESRATALGGIADPATTGSIKPPARAPRAGRGKAGADQRRCRAAARSTAASNRASPASSAASKPRSTASSSSETAALEQVQERYEGKAPRDARACSPSLGLKLDAAPPAAGGPFVPVKLPPANESFERALTRAQHRARLRRTAQQHADLRCRCASRSPAKSTSRSPFGVRIDPFLHVAAMHTGIDFRGDIGEPIHATAAGTVTKAGWSGGYGKMVEIDHGNGLADPLRPSVGDRREGRRRDPHRPGRSAGSARPAARPARTCTTRPASTARPSTRPNFSAAGVKLFGG